jgi:glycosyltransferase involved in cell wall biosynthesis
VTPSTQELLRSTQTCIIVPTYNNEKTLKRVLDAVLGVIANTSIVIVVNDGSTDSSEAILKAFDSSITLLSYSKNKGKGYALKLAFKEAVKLGFKHAITLDSDAQHFPTDIHQFLVAVNSQPNSMIMGVRNMSQEDVPGKSSFGNKFSNFWFKLETGKTLLDTQTGFRLYPLVPLTKMTFFTNRFEFEIEVIVRLAWQYVEFQSVPIKVLYDKEERVTHFRPFIDFTRISLLNTVLVFVSLLYFYPQKLFLNRILIAIKNEAIKSEESNFTKAISLAFGCFMGIVPLWGFQLLIGIPLALLFRLNKVLFIASAHISIPPFIPFILYVSMLQGQLLVNGKIDHDKLLIVSMESIQENFFTYAVGAFSLATVAFIIVFLVSYYSLSLVRKDPRLTDK